MKGLEMEEGKLENERGESVWKPYLYSIFGALSFGGFNIISKVALDQGMSRYSLVAYGFAFGTVTIAALAFLFERQNKSKLSVPVSANIFVLGFLGIFARIMLFAGLEYTAPAFATAINNLNPSLTFILAILCRMEKFNIKEFSGQAKVIGTVISFGGATLISLYKGMTVLSYHSHYNIHHQSSEPKEFLDKNILKGSVMLLVSSLSISTFFIIQTSTIQKYPAPLTLTALLSLTGTVIAAIATAILDHKASSWILKWDITLLAPLYAGIILFGIATYASIVVVHTRGPVFLTAIMPLSLILVAILSPFIIGEELHLGGIIGAILILFGLYAILWGKEVEKKKNVESSNT